MTFINSAILGVVQGLTEFLPISSTAHLVIIPFLLKIKENFLHSLTFDVFLHSGTLLAVLLYYKDKVIKMIFSFFKGFFNKENRDYDFNLALNIIVASLPAFIFGYFFNNIIEQVFRKPVYPAVFLIIFAFLLFIADRIKNQGKEINKVSFIDALIIGVFQAIALLPGVSRSGITITAGLFLGYKRKDAADFSFLLSIPVIFGAVVFGIKDIMEQKINNADWLILATGFIFAFLSGIIAIKFLLSYIKRFSYLIFVVYRIIIGIIILVLVALGKI